MTMIEDLQRVLDDARALVSPLSAAELTTPTPCEGWDVTALLSHMTTVVQSFAAGLRGDEFKPTAGTSGEEASDIKTAYGQGVDALMTAASAPGALETISDRREGREVGAIARFQPRSDVRHAWFQVGRVSLKRDQRLCVLRRGRSEIVS